MLDKIKNFWDTCDNLYHEDEYDFLLKPTKKGWKLTISHSYRGKVSHHPSKIIFDDYISEETFDEKLKDLMVKMQERADFLFKTSQENSEKLKKELEECLKRYENASIEIARRADSIKRIKEQQINTE